ncbi:hypothetical protein BHE74_00015329 [Ensete ventricosum]|nr:hypothetical protein GW17_00014882 [Ensete ventricosum]RWW76551.1 hypothetical protein BHE74_00015329 [Ensete ventricosum]
MHRPNSHLLVVDLRRNFGLLRFFVALKVEEAVLLSMAQHRRASTKSAPSLSGEGQNPAEAFELSQEESEDVLFKQFHSFIDTAIAVERGLFELKKLGIESQLWEACHHRSEAPSDT